MTFVAAEAITPDNLTSQDMSSSDPQPSEDSVNLSLVAIEKEGLVKLASSARSRRRILTRAGKNPLERILGQNWASFRVILDMRQTTYIDSSAIGWLIGSHKSFKTQGGTMVLHDVPQTIKQMLDLLHVGKVVPIAANAQAARELAIAAPAAEGQA